MVLCYTLFSLGIIFIYGLLLCITGGLWDVFYSFQPVFWTTKQKHHDGVHELLQLIQLFFMLLYSALFSLG